MFSRAPMGATTQPIAPLLVTQLPPTQVSPVHAEHPGSEGADDLQAPCHWLPPGCEVLLQPQGECCFAQIPDSLAPSFPDSRLSPCRSRAWTRDVQPLLPLLHVSPPLDCITAALVPCLPALPPGRQPQRFHKKKYFTLQNAILLKNRAAGESRAVCSAGAGCRDGGNQQWRHCCFFPLRHTAPPGWEKPAGVTPSSLGEPMAMKVAEQPADAGLARWAQDPQHDAPGHPASP